MNLTLIIAENCEACERAIQALNKIQLNNPQIIINFIDSKSYKNLKIQITPALFINDLLFSYGDIDETKLIKKLI